MIFAYAKNKDADQQRGNHAADQCLSFHYIDSTILLLPKSAGCYSSVGSDVAWE